MNQSNNPYENKVFGKFMNGTIKSNMHVDVEIIDEYEESIESDSSLNVRLPKRVSIESDEYSFNR